MQHEGVGANLYTIGNLCKNRVNGHGGYIITLSGTCK